MQSLIATKKLMMKKRWYNIQGKSVEYVYECLCNGKCPSHDMISSKISKILISSHIYYPYSPNLRINGNELRIDNVKNM